MAGPALRKVDSHSSIHEAALYEAEELTELLENCLRKNQLHHALEVAYTTVEHWESRTLQHAQAEEEGLYNELKETKPEIHDSIVALTRDHDIMRTLVEEIKDILEKDGVGLDVLQRFQALILVNGIHNRDEMKVLDE